MDRAEAIRQLMAQHATLKAEQAQRLSYWQKRAEFTIPHKAAIASPLTPGANAYREKYDATGMLDATQFAADLYTHMSPRGRWFILSPVAGSARERDRGYGRFLQERTERLHRALAGTNWDTEIHNAYEDLAMGTCCVAAKRHEANAFTLSTRPMGEYTFEVDEQGSPDTVFVERQLTAAQAAKKWGLKKIDPELAENLSRLDPGAYTETRNYVNVCRPNERWEPSGIVSRGYPYESLWIEAGKEPRLIQRGGTRRLRYVISRFWRPTGMRWGMGPTDMAFGPIRCLDKASVITLKYAAKAMDPPLIGPDDGSYHPLDSSPGTIIMARMGATDRVKPGFLELTADHRLAQFLFEYYGMQVARAYMADVFRVLADRKQRTAKEVVTILEKSFDVAIPVHARIRMELFVPLIRLCLELLTEWELGIRGWRYGGQALPEYEYELDLVSPLALAIKYAELQSMSDLWVLNSRLAEVDPAVWDNYSLDEMSRAIGDNMGVPESWKRSVTEVRAIREWRAQRLAEQQALEQAKLAAETAEKLGRPAAPNSLLAEVA